MKIRTFLATILLFSIVIMACSPDDPDFIPVPDRDRTEQQVSDNDILIEYLQTHYYNKSQLAMLANPNPSDIILKTFDGTPEEGYALLFGDENLITRTTNFENTDYTYFILKLNQGGGEESPKFTDKVRVEYEGRLVTDNSLFDSAVTPADFDLVGFGVNTGVIRAWQIIYPEFNAAASFSTGANVEYNNFGLGVMFIPSGLAYFSRQLNGIPSYSNLIFKFSLLQTQINDHDSDGIPSFLEDLNNNLNTFDEDTDEDLIVNYVDPDDDGDGVATINELERTEYTVDTNLGETEPVLAANEFELNRTTQDGVITIITGTIVDSDANGIMDYLDENISIDYSTQS
ncbi:FKBP-type peptidyl-prolyl cis-trans isomerase [Winogradskyella litorisediminis]|uniref:peptidylprolyl isomerase n=1 Tax=Winogradskyella litorisediminis TaxID=1156618 RepID=A0ABW3NAJ2_9FLAO